MAKVHSLAVRKARGQMGGMVYSTYGGQTIVREKPAVVSNPRTNSQMNQRIKMANVVGLYKPNRAWMERWAFPNRPQKWSNYNAYMSENLAKSVISLTKVECELGAAVLEPLTFTKGTLPIIPCTYNRINGWITDILLHNVFDPAWTVAEFTTNLLDSSRGWQEGDQLSIILMEQYLKTVAYTPNIGSGAPVPIIKPVVETKACEVTLDSSNTADKMEDFGFDEVFAANRTLIIAPNALFLDEDAIAHGILFVHSRKNDGAVDVSTQALIIDDYTTFNQYASTEQRRLARASYNATSDAFLVPNAHQGGDVEVTQGIANVNGFTAGATFNVSEYGAGNKLTIQMSMPFTDIMSDITLKCYADSQTEGGGIVEGSIATDDADADAGTITSKPWTSVTLPGDYEAVRILSVSITIDQQLYTINFA